MTTTPSSNLPKNFQPKEAEERWSQYWEESGFFRADNSSTAPHYSIVIPPPNVTGALHLGHGLVQTIQDVLIRHHRMRGFNTLWVPGTDHAGIATQQVVQEKLRQEGRSRVEMGREAFLAEVWKWKDQYHARITSQIRHLGCSVDWSREAFTLDEERAHAVRVAFKKLYDEGVIYRGKYLVNWDPVALTALADDEVEYEDEVGHLWHLKYPFADGSGRFAIVATTRPETMLGDVAVAVNPADPRYKDLIGTEVILPIVNRRIPIIADDFVKAEFGSGMVKITPAHDPNDFLCGTRHNLPMIDVFTDTAKMNENAPERYRGMDRYDARNAVVEELKGLGLIDKIEKHDHRVGRSYRSKAIIEPRLSDQWFVRWGKMAERAVEAVKSGEINITPEDQKNTFFAWMGNLRDWCISRQLWWGHRIPIWYRLDDPSVMVCHDGDGVPPEVAADPTAWRQDEDVLDTWFSSALWPFSTMGWPNKTKDLDTYFPTSVLVTGHDILFFWVARMMMMSYGLTEKKPFEDVFLHGLIFGKSYYRRRGGDLELISPKERNELRLDDLDKLPQGIEYRWEKMSKSKGNVIDPIEMFDLYGVDATRIALVGHIGGRTIEIDRQRIAGYRNFVNKLWNASRFVLMVTEDLTAEEFGNLDEAALEREDKWIISELSKTLAEANKAIASYRFSDYISSLYSFLWTDYCDWYLELVKARVYAKDGDAASSRTAKIVLLRVLENTLRMLHPVIPFVTEEIWQLLKERLGSAATNGIAPHGLGSASICVAPWPTIQNNYTKDVEETVYAKDVINAIRNIRGENGLPMDSKLEVHFYDEVASNRSVINEMKNAIALITNSQSITIQDVYTALPGAAEKTSGQVKIQVPIPTELKAAEIARLKKEIEKLQKGLSATNGKLNNEKFVSSAPADVVEKEREKLRLYEADIVANQSKLAALEGGA